MSEPGSAQPSIPEWASSTLLDLISRRSAEYHYIQENGRDVVYVSPAVEDLLGYTPEEFAGHRTEIPDWNSPRTREAKKHWERTRDLPAGEPMAPYLIDVRHRDGTQRTHEIHERWALGPDQRRYLLGLAVDVTDRVLVETEFDLLQQMTGVVSYFGVFTETGLRMEYLGPSYERVFRVPREASVGDFAAFMTHVHREDLGPLRSEIEVIVSGHGPDRWSFRYRLVTPEGETRWISDRGVLERGNDGKPRRIMGLAEDITEQTLAEQERRDRDAMHTRAQKLEIVGHLAAGVAHNFSNLLLAIQGYIGLAQRTLEPDHPAIEALSKIEETSEQARGLTRSLLTLSHRRPTQRVPLDLSANLVGAVRLLRRTLPTNIGVSHRLEPGVRVRGDASQIDQVVLNTAVNARDSMPDGGELSIELTTDDGNAVLVIADTGHGMDGPTRARAFEPFFTTKAPDNGTGLGLSISRGIIVDHGGKIDLHSRPGAGTRVVISLPLLAADPSQAEADPAPDSERGVVLLVYPAGLVRRVVKTMLGELGQDVLLAESLGDARERLGRDETTAMFLDPAVAGDDHDRVSAEVQALLDAAGPRRVVLVTDEPERWGRLRLGSSGVLLPRPFMRADLGAALTPSAPS